MMINRDEQIYDKKCIEESYPLDTSTSIRNFKTVEEVNEYLEYSFQDFVTANSKRLFCPLLKEVIGCVLEAAYTQIKHLNQEASIHKQFLDFSFLRHVCTFFSNYTLPKEYNPMYCVETTLEQINTELGRLGTEIANQCLGEYIDECN